MKFKEHVLKHLKTYIITLVISLIVGATIFLLYYFLQEQTLYGAMNGVGVAGAILLGVGLLCLVARLGAFDTMSYGFRQLFSSMFSKDANRYNDMVEYKEAKDVTRKNASHYYVIMMIVSILFFIAYIALSIYRANIYK